eukprot:SAG31_NODE_486_length_15001_cov_8.454405_9_plen_61_part_00
MYYSGTLSKLIRIPEADWKNLEVDDDTVHPFICLFPALLHVAVLSPHIRASWGMWECGMA